jgi:hypothetical protein
MLYYAMVATSVLGLCTAKKVGCSITIYINSPTARIVSELPTILTSAHDISQSSRLGEARLRWCCFSRCRLLTL